MNAIKVAPLIGIFALVAACSGSGKKQARSKIGNARAASEELKSPDAINATEEDSDSTDETKTQTKTDTDRTTSKSETTNTGTHATTAPDSGPAPLTGLPLECKESGTNWAMSGDKCVFKPTACSVDMLASDADAEIVYGPRMGVASGGLRMSAAWAQKRAGQYELVYRSFDGTAWSMPANVQTTIGIVPGKIRIAVSDIGVATAVWQGPLPGGGIYSRNFDHGQWSAEAKIDPVGGSPAFDPDLALDSEGTPVVVYRQTTTAGAAQTRMHSSAYKAGAWSSPLALDDYTAGEALAPVISTNSAGDMMVVWVADITKRGEGIELKSQVRKTKDAWKAVVSTTKLSFTSEIFPRLSLGNDGTALVSWPLTDSNGAPKIAAARYDGTAWTRLSDPDSAATVDLHDPQFMPSPQGVFALTWVRTDPAAGDSIAISTFTPPATWNAPTVLTAKDGGHILNHTGIGFAGPGAQQVYEMVWTQNQNGKNQRWTSYFDGTKWSEPFQGDEDLWGGMDGATAAGDPKGHAALAWTQFNRNIFVERNFKCNAQPCRSGEVRVADFNMCQNSACTAATERPLAHGHWESDTTYSGGVLKPVCDQGATWTDPNSKEGMTCKYSTWSSMNGTCRPNDCQGSPELEGVGTLSTTGNIPDGTVLEASCGTGYQPGKASLKCSMGEWSTLASCVPIGCEVSPPAGNRAAWVFTPPNGTSPTTTPPFKSGTTATASCNFGYLGTPTASCAVHQWDVSGECQPIACRNATGYISGGQPQVLENGRWEAEEAVEGQVVKGICNAGYGTNDPSYTYPTLTCTTGSWVRARSCVPSACNWLPVTNISWNPPLNSSNSLFHGETSTGTCINGSTFSPAPGTNATKVSATCNLGQATIIGRCVP